MVPPYRTRAKCNWSTPNYYSQQTLGKGIGNSLWRVARRTDKKPSQKGELLTDDFAPVNLYDTIGERIGRKK